MRRLLILLCLSMLVAPAAAPASRSQTVSFEAPRDLWTRPPREGALDEINGLGVKALRVILYWRDVAPSPRSATPPSFAETRPGGLRLVSRYDAADRRRPLARDARPADGQRPGAALGHALAAQPATRGRRPSASSASCRPSARTTATAISLWSIWNEPNHPEFLRPQFFRGKPASGIWYRKLFLAGYKGLQRAGVAHPHVLMGETAPVGTSNVVAPLVFLNTALCIDRRSLRTHKVCKKLPAYGYAHHAYTRRQGPFYVPSGRNDVTIGSLSRLTRALDRASRRHKLKRRMPVYLTEFGIQSTPDPLYGVSQLRQNEFRAISERIAYDNYRVQVVLAVPAARRQPPRARAPRLSRYPGFESGLRFANGKPKLVAEVVRACRSSRCAAAAACRSGAWPAARTGA